MGSNGGQDPWSRAELGQLLCELELFDDPEPGWEEAGDGNINWVRRVRSHASGRTLIVKHARPALERFPEYTTSTRRIVLENRYYEITRPYDSDGVCPVVLHFDEERRLLVLEDLGDAERLDAALSRDATVGPALAAVAGFLGRVHAATGHEEGLAARFDNDEIRRLHGNHIFKLPYEENAFPLPTEIRARASAVKRNPVVRETAARSYERYLEPCGSLVHGDVQAGNILLTQSAPTLLDAEIAHVGDPAFDLGTLVAHLWLPRIADRREARAREQTETVWNTYRTTIGASHSPSFPSVARYAALEIMRRTIGAARSVALTSPSCSLVAIDLAEQLMQTPPADPRGVSLP